MARVLCLAVLIGLCVVPGADAAGRLPLASRYMGLAVAPGGHVWVAAADGRRGSWAEVVDGRPRWRRYAGRAVGLLSARPDGGAWLLARSDRVLRLSPGGGVARFGSLDVPFGHSKFTDVSVLGVTASDGSFVLAGRLGRFLRVSADGTATPQTAPIPRGFRRGCFAGGMAAASGGALVLSDFPCGRLLTVTPAGAVTSVNLRTPAGTRRWPAGVLARPDGTIWFTAVKLVGRNIGEVIGRVAPDGTLTEFAAPSVALAPRPLVATPDGSVWAAVASECMLYRVHDGVVTRVNAPFRVHDLQFEADGSAWLQGWTRLRHLSAAQLAAERPRRCDTHPPRMRLPTLEHDTVSLQRLRAAGLRVTASEPADLTGDVLLAGRRFYVHRVLRRATTIRFPRALLDRSARRLAAGHRVEIVFNAILRDASGNGIAGPGPFRVVR